MAINPLNDDWLRAKIEERAASDHDYFNLWTGKSQAAPLWTVAAIAQMAGHSGPTDLATLDQIDLVCTATAADIDKGLGRLLQWQVFNVIETRRADSLLSDIGKDLLKGMEIEYQNHYKETLGSANETLALYLNAQYCDFFRLETHLYLLDALGYQVGQPLIVKKI